MNSKKDKILRQAQNIMLDILLDVDTICKKYNIQYWLDSGTLLGAIRHKGFIPWDDDLDIAMSIEDYKLFCKIAQDELPQGLYLQNSNSDKLFPYDFTKIRSDRGVLIEKHEEGKVVMYNQGIFIDIFPVISISSSLVRRLEYKIFFLLIKIFSYKYLNQRAIRKRLIAYIDSIHNGWKKEKSYVIYSGKIPDLNFYVEKLTIFPLKSIIFEGKEFPSPNDSPKYLEAYYGKSYMQLPPKEKRKTHAYSIEVFDG